MAQTVTDVTYETITLARRGGVTTVTLNRPDKKNAMNPQMHEDMYDVLTRLEGDDATRVLVVTGAGDSFCAGQDLKEYFKDVGDDEARRNRNKRISDEWRNRLLRLFPKPTIAMINGFCFGGAFTIVGACDFAIAAEDATFGLSEVNWGAIPGGMVSKVIGSQMAFRDALYYAMTGERFDGRKAAEMRWVNFAAPRAELAAKTYELADKLAAMDAAALRSTKEAFKIVQEMPFDVAFNWLLAKSNELKWRHSIEGEGEAGLDKFLRKEFKPGLGSHTTAGDAKKETP
jgi:trans-feruloyl-CoA hydratase/vanillin synthase